MSFMLLVSRGLSRTDDSNATNRPSPLTSSVAEHVVEVVSCWRATRGTATAIAVQTTQASVNGAAVMGGCPGLPVRAS